MAGIGFGANTTSLSAPQGSGAQVVAPVEKRMDIGFVNDVVKLFASKEKADPDKDVLQKYSAEYDRINQGLETGALTNAQAASKAQMLYSRTMATHGHLAKDLNTITEGFRGNSKMSDADKQMSEQRTLRKEQLSAAAGNGWVILPGMSPVQEDSIINASAHATKVSKELSAFYQKAAYERENGRFNQEQTDREFKATTTRLMAESAGFHIDAFNNVADGLFASVQSNPGNLPQAQAQLATQFASIQAKLQAAAGTNPELAGHYRSLFTELYETRKKMLDPNLMTESERVRLEGEVKVIQLKAQKVALEDPVVVAAYVNSTLFGNSPTAQFHGGRAASSVMVRLGDVKAGEFVPSVIGDPAVEEPVLKSTKEILDKVVSGQFSGDPAKFNEQSTNLINNVLRDIGKQINEPGKLTPKALTNALDLVSDPSFGKVSEQGKMDGDARTAVKNVFQAGIHAPMVRLLQNKLNETIPKGYMNGNGELNVNTLVKDIKFSGASVVVEFADNPLVSQQGKALFRQDMSQTERALTKVVRAAAHIEGHTDYQKAWEALRPSLLPDLYKSPKALEVGTVVKGKDGTQFKYLGGPDGRATSWQQLAKPSTAN